MKPSESTTVFVSLAASNGVALSQCTPRDGITQMFSFYQAVSPEGCHGSSGDMLLFQWGTYDWGAGENFELNITRQFIEQELQDDDAISQLSLTFKFVPPPERALLGEGNRWCEGPTELETFREFVFNSPSFTAVADRTPVAAELTHFYV